MKEEKREAMIAEIANEITMERDKLKYNEGWNDCMVAVRTRLGQVMTQPVNQGES